MLGLHGAATSAHPASPDLAFCCQVASALFPGLYTNSDGSVLVVQPCITENLLRPSTAARTTRCPKPWSSARPSIVNWRALEAALVTSPLAQGKPPYHDPAIIDLIRSGVPLGDIPHSDFTVNVSPDPPSEAKEFLDSQLLHDIDRGYVQLVGPTSSFKQSFQALGFRRGYASSIGAFDKNAMRTEVQTPIQNPRFCRSAGTSPPGRTWISNGEKHSTFQLRTRGELPTHASWSIQSSVKW